MMYMDYNTGGYKDIIENPSSYHSLLNIILVIFTKNVSSYTPGQIVSKRKLKR